MSLNYSLKKKKMKIQISPFSEKKQHEFCLEALDLKKNIECDFIELGMLLSKIKEFRYYEAGWSSWEEYVMELKMSEASISRLVRIYEVFILRFKFAPAQLAPIGWANVAELLPQIKETTPRNDVQGWLGEMVNLPRQDVRRAIIERKTGISMADCKHKDTYTIKICRGCGDRWKL